MWGWDVGMGCGDRMWGCDVGMGCRGDYFPFQNIAISISGFT